MDRSRRDGPATIGRGAEERALRFLEQAGLVLLERNFRCRSGEIDLIMQDSATLVFVEVRMRRQSRFGGAAESINGPKLRRIRSAAGLWLRITQRCDPVRLDVVTLDGEHCDTARIAWIRGVDT